MAIPKPTIIDMNLTRLNPWFSLTSNRIVVEIYKNIPITIAVKYS